MILLIATLPFYPASLLGVQALILPTVGALIVVASIAAGERMVKRGPTPVGSLAYRSLGEALPVVPAVIASATLALTLVWTAATTALASADDMGRPGRAVAAMAATSISNYDAALKHHEGSSTALLPIAVVVLGVAAVLALVGFAMFAFPLVFARRLPDGKQVVPVTVHGGDAAPGVGSSASLSQGSTAASAEGSSAAPAQGPRAALAEGSPAAPASAAGSDSEAARS